MLLTPEFEFLAIVIRVILRLLGFEIENEIIPD